MLEEKKYRFALIWVRSPAKGADESKEHIVMNLNYHDFKYLLDDVDWDLYYGLPPLWGDWPVENREEFALAGAGRLPAVRQACESGKHNAIVLLGGGEPGFFESRELAKKYNLPVTSCAFSQMHIASMLGNKFSVIDLAESHNMYYYNLVVEHHFTQRCASIRNINYPLPRPGSYEGEPSLQKERAKALNGEPSEAVERTVREAVAAIEEDGAEVITFGCSGTFWLKPFLQRRLNEMGWEVPVLEGYSCAISLAKIMVDLGVDVSGLMFPGDRPRQLRVKRF